MRRVQAAAAPQQGGSGQASGSKVGGGILGVLGSIIPGWGQTPKPAPPTPAAAAEGEACGAIWRFEPIGAAAAQRASKCDGRGSLPCPLILVSAESGPTSIQIITEKNSDDSESEDEGSKKVRFWRGACRPALCAYAASSAAAYAASSAYRIREMPSSFPAHPAEAPLCPCLPPHVVLLRGPLTAGAAAAQVFPAWTKSPVMRAQLLRQVVHAHARVRFRAIEAARLE